MNKIYRVIWNSALRCFVVASEMATGKTKSSTTTLALVSGLVVATTSHAANRQIVLTDGSAAYENYPVATAGVGEHGLLISGSDGNLTFTDGFVTASGSGASAAWVQDGATLNATTAKMATLAANNITLNLLNGATANLTGSTVSALGAGSTSVSASGNSVLAGENVTVNSAGRGISLDNSRLDVDTLEINTTGANGFGLYAINGSQVSAKNLTVTTSGSNGRAIAATGNGTSVTLDGGTINTASARGHGVYAGSNATINVSNMNITTAATGQADTNGAAGLFLDTGGHIIADNLTLTSASSAIWMRQGILDGNNLKITFAVPPGHGPAIWGFSGSVLNLQNSDIALAVAGTQGIYTDAGTANLDGVKIHGESGGIGLMVRYDGSLNAKNTDVLINNADGDNASGLVMSNGSGLGNATLTDSRIMVNGSHASGVTAGSARQNLALNNTLIASDNIAVNVQNGASLQVNASGSTLNAPVLLTAGEVNDTGATAGYVYLDATNASMLSGDVTLVRDYVTDSRVSLDTGSVWQGAATGLNTLSLSNGSQWNMTADSNVRDLNLADSTVVFTHDSDSFKALTVEGDYTSHGGTLVLNSILMGDGSAHDKLQVLGNTSGDTGVVINNAGGSGAKTINGIEVISVGGSSDGVFTQQGRIVAGAYDYRLTRGDGSNDKNWYLISEASPVDPVTPVDPETPIDPVNPVDPTGPGTNPGTNPGSPLKPVMVTRPEAGSYLANMMAASNLFALRLNDRGGETQYTDAITGEKKVTSLWMRNVGGHNTSRDSSGQLDTQTNRYVLQLGGDVGKWTLTGNDSLHLGALAGYGNAQSSTDSKVNGYRSKGQVNGYSVGVYSTWYQNAEANTGAYVDSWAQYSWFNNSVKGDGLAQESYKSRGTSASLESGYRWKIGEDSHKSSYFIEPNAQVIWSNIQADSLTEHNGTRVNTNGSGNVQSRVGVRASMRTDAQKGKPVFTPYLEANWINDSQNVGVSMNGASIEQRGSQNIAELRGGMSGQISERVNLWGSIGQQMGSEHYRDTTATLGMKVAF